MSAPSWSASQILEQFKKTLPYGRAWPRDAGTVMESILKCFMPTAERTINDARAFIRGSFPATVLSVLPEWEGTLGLPDPCAGESPTIEQRRAQVIARLSDSGGSSVEYFINFAKILGYQITIDQFAPARAGLLKVGDALNGESWAYAWRINYPGYSLSEFAAGSSAGEPLSSWGNAVLECEIKSRVPAHTVIIFAQSHNFVDDFGGDII